MEWKTLYLPLALVLLALIVLAVKAGGRYPYRRKRWLFTKAEWHFFQALSQALNPQFLIMGKVRIADLLGVEGIRPHLLQACGLCHLQSAIWGNPLRH